jgi:hypothetical protein
MAFGPPNTPTDASDTINDFLSRESGRIKNDILARTTQTSVWLDLQKTGTWTDGMGYSFSVQTMGRILPVDTATALQKKLTWDTLASTNLTAFDGNPAGISGGSSIPRTTQLRGGFSTRTVSLARAALNSPNLSLQDLRMHFNASRQLGLVKEKLGEATERVLIDRYRDEYDKWADTKVLVKHNGVTQTSGLAGTAFSLTPSAGVSAGILKNGLLLNLYNKLVRAGAGKGALGRVDGAPIFGFVTSSENSMRLKQEADYRDDYRWNPKVVNELLAALGATTAPVLGFQHIIDPLPPRWNWTGAAWSWVPPYYEIAGDGETKIISENPDYETAQWEDSYIYHQDVDLALFPGSLSNVNAATFQSLDYRGNWRWVNEYDKESNPDKQIGFFRGVFEHGTEPHYPEYGVVIRSARCNLSPIYAACS